MADQMRDCPEPLDVVHGQRQTPAKRSANSTLAQCGFPQRHRLTCTRSVTDQPYAAKFFNVRP
jgi:hypothetical protein